MLRWLTYSSEHMAPDTIRVALPLRSKRKHILVVRVLEETDQLLARVVPIDKEPVFLVDEINPER